VVRLTFGVGISLELGLGIWSFDSSRRARFDQFHEQRDAGLRFAVEPDIHGIQSGFGKFQLLDVDDEIAREKVHVLRQPDFHGHGREVRHDGMAVGIDEIEGELALAFVGGKKRDAQRDGALRMDGGKLRCADGVKRAEKVQLFVVVRRRVAEDGHLDVHAKIKP